MILNQHMRLPSSDLSQALEAAAAFCQAQIDMYAAVICVSKLLLLHAGMGMLSHHMA